MKKSLRYILFCFLLLASSQTALAQQFTVTGTVTDKNTGQPLIGANVFNKASGNGTVTGENGEFTLQLPNGPTTLRISYIGYITRTVEVSPSNSQINIDLSLKTTSLNQLIVTGLAGTTKRRNLASDVTKISAKQLTATTATGTVSDALSAKIPGVIIQSTGGAPGGGFNIKIRGISTLGGSQSQPLIIIDGVYMNNSTISTGRWKAIGGTRSGEDRGGNRLAGLNPENIKSIQVLKGAAAASIYGPRGNAGVVIIHTKRGSSGPTQINVSESAGFARPLHLIGVDSWGPQKIYDYYFNPNNPKKSKQKIQAETAKYNAAKKAGNLHNYENVFYDHTRFVNKSFISASGGSKKTQFFVSGGYDKTNGLMYNTGFTRSSFRADLDHHINDRIKISTNSYFVRTDSKRGFTGNQNGSGGSVGYTLAQVPTYAQLFPNEDGIYPTNDYFNGNPLQLVHTAKNDQKITRTIQSLNLTADLYRGGGATVSFILKGGVDFLNFHSEVYLPNALQNQQASANPGNVLRTKQTNLSSNLNMFLKYIQDTENFTFTTQAGFTRSGQLQHRQQVQGLGLVAGQDNITSASVQSVLFQGKRHIVNTGLFGQEQVNWSNKLIATAGVRLGRSSKNFKQDRYYAFPKATMALNVSNFDFFQSDKINQLKLRIAYGQTGGLPNYGSIYHVFNSTFVGNQIGLVISNQDVDTTLVPERAIGLEFGVDLGFFNNRLSISATRYRKKTKDLILPLPTATSTGVTAIATNAGTMRNRGIELSLNATPVQKSNILWSTLISFYRNRTKITKLTIPPYVNGGFGPSLGAYVFAEGYSPTSIVATPAVKTGSLFTIYGDAQPDFVMSFSNTFSFLNGFRLSFLWHWSHGNDNINLHELLTDGGGTSPDWGSKAYKKRQEAGGYIMDASYIRLKQIGLHYTVPESFLNTAFGSTVKQVRLGVSANNVLLFSDYPGYDPQASAFGVRAVNSSVVVAPYPSSRTVLFSVDFKF